MQESDKNNAVEAFYYDISIIREFLQLLAVVNIDDVSRFTLNNLAGILLKNVESIENAFENKL